MPLKNSNVIVVSAVNLVEGGGLSILKKCVQELSEFNKDNKYKIFILVHSISLLPEYENITYIAYPKAKKNWIFRTFYEYIYFYIVSVKLNPLVWFSLHDMTPNVKSGLCLYTYMHNPAPFFQKRIGLKLNWKFNLFVKFYKYLYRLNVKKTTACIVQQNWFREKISELCNISLEKIIVAKPEYEAKDVSIYDITFNKNQFFFNSYPRDFKNFDVICKACKILEERNFQQDWNVYLTIDGSENEYSNRLVEKYSSNRHINFIGLVSRDKCEEYYQTSEVLIFPSLLETWGLPISEFKIYDKKMILADLPYAHESASGAKQVTFFNPDDANELADKMEAVILRKSENAFFPCEQLEIAEPYCTNWKELFEKIIPKI